MGIEYLGAKYAETEERVQRNLNQVAVFFFFFKLPNPFFQAAFVQPPLK